MLELQNITDQTVSMLPKIGLGIMVFLLFILASWLFKAIITKKVKPKTKNPLLAEFLGKIMGFVIIVVGFVFFLHIIGLGDIAKHIMAGAGITTFVIGFAFKDIGENFLSGILMAFKSPFAIGDLIETGGTVGYVYELDLRVTSVKTLDGKDVFIPNSQIIKNPLYNNTIDGFLRYDFVIGLDYNANVKEVIELIKKTLEEVPEVLQGDKKPVIVAEELMASTINVRIFYWIDTFKSKSKAYHLKIKSHVITTVVEQMNNNGVYLPADIVELKNYNSQLFQTK